MYITPVSQAQMIPNGGLETWITVSSGASSYENPEDWVTANDIFSGIVYLIQVADN